MVVSPAILTIAQTAGADSGPTWQWVATIAINALVAVAVFVIRQHLTTAAKERKESDGKVQEAFAEMNKSIKAQADATVVLSTRMGAIEQRLHDGDARFDRLDQRDREIETRMVEGLTKIDTRLTHIERNQERAKSA